MEIILVLHNIRSVYNVGSILRSADGFGVNQVIYSGYTPTPLPYSHLLPHLAQKITDQIRKTALGAEQTLPSMYSDDLLKTLRHYRTMGYQILALENNLQDQTTYLLSDHNLPSRLSSKVVILLGEEVAGLSPDFFNAVDLFLEIPMFGHKESFNVSVATAILLFYLRTQVK